ncbi:unnamed protein product [Protopolystoma xenopodis]|uniref:Uncharacterized protein n=1 Tax=Protopolystoma xenopodis TaxID=117903 RepID=A0A448WRN9_9PLAT|nr:unnamed protein product [Protopolystoma xenopodis]
MRLSSSWSSRSSQSTSPSPIACACPPQTAMRHTLLLHLVATASRPASNGLLSYLSSNPAKSHNSRNKVAELASSGRGEKATMFAYSEDICSARFGIRPNLTLRPLLQPT